MLAPQRFEDPQPEQAKQRNQGKVVAVGRQPGGGDQSFELQMAKAESGRLCGYGGPADVVGRRVRQDLVDDTDAVEADHDDSRRETVEGW